MRGQQNAGLLARVVGAFVLVAAALTLPAPLLARDPQPRAVLRGHTAEVCALAFSPDGTTLASGSRSELGECSVRLWDVATGRTTTTLTAKAKEREDGYTSGAVAFSPDGKILAAANWWGKVWLWDLGTRTGRMLPNTPRQMMRPVVGFSPDGRTVALGGTCDPKLFRWDVATSKRYDPLVVNGEDETEWGVQALAYLPDGKTLLTTSGDVIKVWDHATGKNTATVRLKDTARGAAFSPDRKTVATGIRTGDPVRFRGVTVWEVGTGKARLTITGLPDDVSTLAYSPDGKTLAIACEDGTVKLWDSATGKELGTLKGHTGSVECLAFSPDGKTLAAPGEDNTILLWDVARPK
jgi:WD40 repeat protein